MDPAPSLPRVWLLATRPATLTAALSPVMVGAAAAWRASGGLGYRWGAVVAALLGAMFIQVGTNLANDVFDFEKGADTAERLGPTRVTQAGLLSPSQVRAGMVASFALATAAGVYLTAVAGWPIVAIGVASIASGVAYTGGPYPLGYNGLGDVFVFVFFGLVAVGGTAFVALGHVPALALALAVPVGALATAVLVVNNVRDHVTDVRAGKRTVVVRFGRRFGVAEYLACWAAALAVPVALAASRRSPWMVLPLLTLPMAVALSRKVATLEGRPLNPVLGATAGALLLHSLLTVAGLLQG
ncbi:MAG: 1,4-dihydroxy-2-naphthoate polyprenyltransferase [Deltaproteobacteria bacterium]|nr:1,4-dihydroxy-2-naphthoate polyprenyltransferase [Deltaproteobacteria bacterium]